MVRKLMIGAMLACAMTTQAAPPVFDVKAPAWTKLAVSKSGEGINIRKSPSTTAPKLIYNESKVDNYDIPANYYGYWSKAVARSPLFAVTFTGPDVVVSEQPGWVQVRNIGPRGEENGWVSAKYCAVVTPEAMHYPSQPAGSRFRWLNSGNDTTEGVYAIYLLDDEMNGEATFYIGRLVNGLLVCPYTLYCDTFDTTDGKTCIERLGDNRYGLRYNPKTEGDGYEIMLSKFGDSLIREIIELATPDKEYVVYLYDGNYSVTAF